MNSKVVIPRHHRGSNMMTSMKALGLVAVAWGVVFPSLLWSLSHLLQRV